MGIALDRLAYCLRRRAQHETGVYFASLSARTLVYKGMLTTEQLRAGLSRAARRADGQCAGGGALPLLHQHLPGLGAGPPVPDDRPQRRDQHGDGQPELDAGPRGAAGQRRDPRRPGAAVPDLHAGRLRLGLVRRGGRAAAPRRPLAAARDADDDPGGVGEQPHDGPAAAGLLRLPLLPDGAVGRAGRRGLHRRHPGRRGAGPQRAAARPLLGDRRRPGGAGLRGRRAGHRPGQGDRAEGPAAAGPDVPGRPRPAPDHLRRGGQERRWPPPSRTASGCSPAGCCSPTCPTASTWCTPTPRSPGGSRCSATPRRSCG